ncbi:MAG: CDP-glycerol glycerophosphotransferase family protein [Lachnospiraceae bacterium]|nr:CDP-glycerol glycerophosphotransferase family protein [Lachnospiraceae bacterium]
MYKLTEFFQYWGQLLLLPVYWLSFLFPRNKRIWLFGSTFGKRFADNPKYLYLYMSQHKDKLGIRPVWISHNKDIVRVLNKKGYEAYYFHSLKGIFFALRGKVYLFDNYSKDINFWQSGGALKVNMWHGIPLKKIQADNVFDKFRHPVNLYEKFKNFPRNLSDEKPHHYVLTTSGFLKDIFSSAFRTNNVLISGYPRNDILISRNINNLLSRNEKQQIALIERFTSQKPENKMVLYMPTFRESELDFFNVINVGILQEFLEKNNILFCVKLHPKSKLEEHFKKINTNNILVIDAVSDPYAFLSLSDMLITDYSSIYFDYLLLNRPVLFFNYDMDKYLDNSRELYFNYNEFTPGEKTATQTGLQDALLNFASNSKAYSDNYKLYRNIISEKVFGKKRKMACPVLINDIIHILNHKVR